MNYPLDYESLSGRVTELLAKGLRIKEVARELGISKTSVARIREYAGVAPKERKKKREGYRKPQVSDCMEKSRITVQLARRASELLIEDLRREHPEREINVWKRER